MQEASRCQRTRAHGKCRTIYAASFRWPPWSSSCRSGGGGRMLVVWWGNAVNHSFLHKGTGSTCISFLSKVPRLSSNMSQKSQRQKDMSQQIAETKDMSQKIARTRRKITFFVTCLYDLCKESQKLRRCLTPVAVAKNCCRSVSSLTNTPLRQFSSPFAMPNRWDLDDTITYSKYLLPTC
jgi:hypothetical protein